MRSPVRVRGAVVIGALVTVLGCTGINPDFGAGDQSAAGASTRAGTTSGGSTRASSTSDVSTTTLGSTGSGSGGGGPWYSDEYCARIPITVAAGTVRRDLPSFPMLVEIVDPALIDARSDGADLAFVHPDFGDRGPHELEWFDVQTGTLVAWVRVPVIRADADTLVHLYFCRPDADSGEDPRSVWDAYSGVWHLSEELSQSVRDSTAHGNDGTYSGFGVDQALVSGKVGTAVRFDGENDSIDIEDASELRFSTTGTVSAWVLAESWQLDVGPIFAKSMTFGSAASQNSYYLRAGDGELNFTARVVDGGPSVYWSGWSDLGQWHHVAGVYDGQALRLHFDGEVVGEQALEGMVSDPGFAAHIGSWGEAAGDRWWQGIIDEVRMLQQPRSPEWIRAEFQNQSDPRSFAVAGEVEYR